MPLTQHPKTGQMTAEEARLGQIIAEALHANRAEHGVNAAVLDAITIMGSALRFILEVEGPESARTMVQCAESALAATIASESAVAQARLN